MKRITENAGLIIVTGIFVMIGGAIANLSLVVYAGSGVAIALCALSYLGWKQKKPQPRCRMCGLPGPMALHYEDDGLCKKCFLELVALPGVLGKENTE